MSHSLGAEIFVTVVALRWRNRSARFRELRTTSAFIHYNRNVISRHYDIFRKHWDVLHVPVVLFYLESNEVQYWRKVTNGTLQVGYASHSTDYTCHMCSELLSYFRFFHIPLFLQKQRESCNKKRIRVQNLDQD